MKGIVFYFPFKLVTYLWIHIHEKRGQGSQKYTVHSIFNLSAPLSLYSIGNSLVALYNRYRGIENIYLGHHRKLH